MKAIWSELLFRVHNVTDKVDIIFSILGFSAYNTSSRNRECKRKTIRQYSQSFDQTLESNLLLSFGFVEPATLLRDSFNSEDNQFFKLNFLNADQSESNAY